MVSLYIYTTTLAETIDSVFFICTFVVDVGQRTGCIIRGTRTLTGYLRRVIK